MTASERDGHLVVIDRYSRGARWNQVWTTAVSGLIAAAFALAAWVERDPGFLVGAAGVFAVTTVGMGFLLRQVTYTLDPRGGSLERRANWAGIPLAVRTLPADRFAEIRLGWFGGGGEAPPVYWARLVGREKWTLVESRCESEVREAAERVGRSLGLPVR